MGKSAVVDVLLGLCLDSPRGDKGRKAIREHQGDNQTGVMGAGVAVGECHVVFVDMLTRLQMRLGGDGQMTLGAWCARTLGDVQRMIERVPMNVAALGNEKRVFVLCWDKPDWTTNMKEIEQRARNVASSASASRKRDRDGDGDGDMEEEKEEKEEARDPLGFDFDTTMISNREWDALMRDRGKRRVVIKHVNRWIMDRFDPGPDAAVVIDGGLDSSESELARTGACAPSTSTDMWRAEVESRASVPVLVSRGDVAKSEVFVRALPTRFHNVVGEADLAVQFWIACASDLHHYVFKSDSQPQHAVEFGALTTDSDFIVLCMLAREHTELRSVSRIVLELSTTKCRTRIFDIDLLCELMHTRFFPGQARPVETACAAIIACGNDYVEGVRGLGEKTMFDAFYAAYGGTRPRLAGLVVEHRGEGEGGRGEDKKDKKVFPLHIPENAMAQFLRCVADGAKRSKAQVQTEVEKQIRAGVLRANVEWTLGYMSHGVTMTKREIDTAALSRGGFVQCPQTGRIDRAETMVSLPTV